MKKNFYHQTLRTMGIMGRSPRVLRGRRSRFVGRQARMVTAAPARTAVAEGTAQTFVSPVEANVFNLGKSSIFDPEAAAHNNMILLTLDSTGSPNPVDLVLTAGRYGADPRFSGQLITDGANNLVNDAGNPCTVNVTASYGQESSTSGAWDILQNIMREDGMLIKQTRLAFTEVDQLHENFRFLKIVDFGDDKTEVIAPVVYYNPEQFDLKTIQFKKNYTLGPRRVWKYSMPADRKISMILWVGAILTLDHMLEDYARSQGATIQ